MNLTTNITREELNSFLIANNPQFLQSWQWGEFKKSLGKKVWRLGVIDNQNLIAVCQIIENKLPLSRSYIYTPRGPVFQKNLSQDKITDILKLLLKGARDITIQTATSEEIFFKIEPPLVESNLNEAGLLIKKTKFVQPKDTLVLDLKPSETQILHQMHPKTRYNIKVAEKKGIIITPGDIQDFDDFWQLLEKTSKRNKFHTHPKSYYLQLLEILKSNVTLTKNLYLKLWLAKYEKKIVAGALIAYFGENVTYLHGGSDYDFHRFMAPYLLHWEIIKNAKMEKFSEYDFWGIASTLSKDGSPGWQGLTRFKQGFGGREINYTGAYDFIYNQLWYNIYKVAKKFI